MAAFRLFSKLNTFYGLTAQLLPGGYLKFYEAGTTTPKDVFGDEGLSVNNGVTVDLDSSGRPDVDVWGEGAYFVEVYDSLDVKQGEADDVQIPGAGGLTIPALENGKFLTNNGAVLLWTAIREVPDPTGQSGKLLSNDGENLIWQSPAALPEIPAPDFAVGSDGVRIGNFFMLPGNGTAPASGNKSTSANITFSPPFTALWHVAVTSIGSSFTGSGALVDNAVSGFTVGASATGATVNFNVSDDDNSSGWKITSPVPFTWIAFGLVAS